MTPVELKITITDPAELLAICELLGKDTVAESIKPAKPKKEKPAKPKKEKPAKPEKEPEPVEEPVAEEAEPESEAEEVTEDDVKEAVRNLVQGEGVEAVKAVFAGFGAAKLSDIAPSKYPKVLAALVAEAS